MKDKVYKVIRTLTIPPIVVSILLVSLIINNTIASIEEGFFLVLFLGLIPISSYLFNFLIKGNRETQRKTAFIFTFASYFLGFLYALFFVNEVGIKFIYYVYFFSVVILLILNLFITKASGHIASVTGLVFISFHNISTYTLFYTVPIYMLTFVSSKNLKRHTSKELVLGTMTIVISYIITLLLLHS